MQPIHIPVTPQPPTFSYAQLLARHNARSVANLTAAAHDLSVARRLTQFAKSMRLPLVQPSTFGQVLSEIQAQSIASSLTRFAEAVRLPLPHRSATAPSESATDQNDNTVSTHSVNQ